MNAPGNSFPDSASGPPRHEAGGHKPDRTTEPGPASRKARLMGWLAGKARQGKDKLLSEVVRYVANRWYLEEFGRLHSLNVDSGRRIIFAKLDLDGEATDLDLRVFYQLEKNSEQRWVFILLGVETSRAWINRAVQRSLTDENRTIELPKTISAAARVLGL